MISRQRLWNKTAWIKILNPPLRELRPTVYNSLFCCPCDYFLLVFLPCANSVIYKCLNHYGSHRCCLLNCSDSLLSRHLLELHFLGSLCLDGALDRYWTMEVIRVSSKLGHLIGETLQRSLGLSHGDQICP